MRIITGLAKGTKLKTPRGLEVRPTSDRVKGSLFNILVGRIEDAVIADLFAGTGNLGLEALSRGARSAVFVDNSVTSLNLVRENAGRTKLAGQAELVKSDALGAIDRFNRAGRLFHVLFCDPPYNRGLVAAVLRRLDASSVLYPDGLVVIEHSRHESIPTDLAHFTLKRTERYGETLVSFLSNNV